MQNALGIKSKKARMFFSLSVVIIFILFLYSKTSDHLFPSGQEIIHKEKVSNLANLYITKTDINATTTATYKYYLFDAAKNDVNFLAENKDDTYAFLITNDKNARVTVSDNKINILVSGKIYKFNNLGLYKLSTGIYGVDVYLISSPF